jgi:hypothetical protein
MIGCRVRDDAGNIILDLTDRLGRVLGVVTITSSGGSVTNAGFLDGSPFWVYLKDTNGNFSNQPTISVAGDTLSWSWPSGGGSDGRILYGVY